MATGVQELTNRGQLEARLREGEERFRVLSESSLTGIYLIQEGKFRYVNPAMAKMFGYTVDELVDRLSPLDLVHPDDRHVVAENVRRRIEGEVEEIHYDFRGLRKDGSVVYIEVHGRRIEYGGKIGVMGTLVDITDRKRAEELSQQAIRVRDEFLSAASHELRTPLTSLRLVLQSLARGLHAGRPSVSPQMLDVAVRQSERLATLVNQLLDVGRIQSGRLTLAPEEFDLVADIRQLLERMQMEIARAASPVALRGEDGIVVRWDRSRIDQLLTNLLSNALMYGAGQPVDLTVERVSDGRVRITVRDRGIGIPADRLPHIFERFERATSTRNYGGLGLGLFIARQIALAHAGTISAESELGHGSSFVVELPCELAQAMSLEASQDRGP
jgi:PAS domain S-box-containing protein